MVCGCQVTVHEQEDGPLEEHSRKPHRVLCPPQSPQRQPLPITTALYLARSPHCPLPCCLFHLTQVLNREQRYRGDSHSYGIWCQSLAAAGYSCLWYKDMEVRGHQSFTNAGHSLLTLISGGKQLFSTLFCKYKHSVGSGVRIGNSISLWPCPRSEATQQHSPLPRPQASA